MVALLCADKLAIYLVKISLLSDFEINFDFIHKLGGYVALLLIAVNVLPATKLQFWNGDDEIYQPTKWNLKHDPK